MAGPLLGSCILGASTFCVKQHGADECDAKGLPLTLNTTNIMGRFERLKSLDHPQLAVYLDAKKLKHGSHLVTKFTYYRYLIHPNTLVSWEQLV